MCSPKPNKMGEREGATFQPDILNLRKDGRKTLKRFQGKRFYGFKNVAAFEVPSLLGGKSGAIFGSEMVLVILHLNKSQQTREGGSQEEAYVRERSLIRAVPFPRGRDRTKLRSGSEC